MCQPIWFISMDQIITTSASTLRRKLMASCSGLKAAEHYTILIDGRWKTFEFTLKNLKGEYAETIDHTHFWECLSGKSDHVNSISQNHGRKISGCSDLAIVSALSSGRETGALHRESC